MWLRPLRIQPGTVAWILPRFEGTCDETAPAAGSIVCGRDHIPARRTKTNNSRRLLVKACDRVASPHNIYSLLLLWLTERASRKGTALEK